MPESEIEIGQIGYQELLEAEVQPFPQKGNIFDHARDVGRAIEQTAIVTTATLGLLAITSAFAFTERQRRWIRERDDEMCQHPDDSIPHEGRLEVHHIEPQGWAKTILEKPEEEVDIPENAITLCANHHVGDEGIHPDVAEAKRNYRTNPRSFSDMFAERKRKMAERQKYWNDEWDEKMGLIARIRTDIFGIKNPDREFPTHNKRKREVIK